MGVRLLLAVLVALSGELALTVIGPNSVCASEKFDRLKSSARTDKFETMLHARDGESFDQFKLAQIKPEDKKAVKPTEKAATTIKPADKNSASKSAEKSTTAKPTESANPEFTSALNKGIELFNKNKSEEALVEFQKALDVNPNNTAVRNWMGATYQRMNKHDKAVEVYEKVVELDPDYAEAHNNLAFSYQQTQEYDKAEAEYKRALELKPGFVEARFNVACVLQIEKMNDEALGEFENVLKMDPARTDCYLHIGDLDKDSKNFDKALVNYNKALTELKKSGKKDPQGTADILCKIALIDKEKGDKAKCKEGLEKVMDLDPANYQALLNMGIINFEEKDFTTCLNFLGKALERNPYDAAVHFWLGRYYFSLDSMKNSIKQFSDCQKCDASEHQFPECEEWLEKAKKKQATF